jgi:hypothetical protein
MKVVMRESGATTATVEYQVDGLGRRISRRINGTFDKKWLYRDSLRSEAEVNADGVFTHYVYASNDPNSGAPIALIRAGVLYRVVKDHLGSVRLVVTSRKALITTLGVTCSAKPVRASSPSDLQVVFTTQPRNSCASVHETTTQQRVGGRRKTSLASRGGRRTSMCT